MNFSFNPAEGLVLVDAELSGPSGEATIRLALDTGASQTVVSQTLLESLGYMPSQSRHLIPIATASKKETMPLCKVQSVSALGIRRMRFSVLCHELPFASGIRGVVGLDFFRNQVLTIDFRQGKITLR
jgi:hypothetical protein